MSNIDSDKVSDSVILSLPGKHPDKTQTDKPNHCVLDFVIFTLLISVCVCISVWIFCERVH